MKRVPIFLVFLKLGLTSFGGPIAHIGYFRDEFVLRRKWLSEHGFAELVTLCQFLPGPTSSQVGFLIGLKQGGVTGALLAWLGFTMPSAIVMMAFAFGAIHIDGLYGAALIHGLKLVAVVIVANALWGMSRNLTPDLIRVMIALSSATIILLSGNRAFQIIAIGAGAAAGAVICRAPQLSTESNMSFPISRMAAIIALSLFLILLFGFFAFSYLSPIISFIGKFYQSGSLVFGGGHVVLPLLEREFVNPELIDRNLFLAGYGAAQAIPGPLFTFASYLGVLASNGPGGLLGGIIATVAIFLPSFLLLVGIMPFWTRWRENALFRSAIAGANAAVVGVLATALYDPLWTSSVTDRLDLILVVSGFAALTFLRIPNLAIIFLLPIAVIFQKLAGI